MTIARQLALPVAAAIIWMPTVLVQGQTPAPARTPQAVPAPPIAPAAPSVSPDINRLVDSLHTLGRSEGRIGREIGDSYRKKYGNHFSDSLKASIQAEVQRAMQSGAITQSVAHHVEARVRAQTSGKESTAQIIDRVRRDPDALAMPPADSFVAGGVTIAAAEHRTGTVATVDGALDVFGTVDGDAIAVDGDVVLHPGSHVHGFAFAANGVVRMDGAGGLVDGEIRSIGGAIGPHTGVLAKTPVVAADSRWHAARLALAAFGLMLMLSIGVLTFAEDQLDNVTATLADRFGRSAWYGIVGELLLLPALLAVIVALAITIIGIVVVPFAIIGFVVLAVGAAMLGFMAVAEAAGTSILRSQSQASLTARGAQLRAIVTGVALFGGLWLFTAVVGTDFVIGGIIRGLAVIVTAVAVTVGFGAVLVWRLELRRAGRVAKVSAVLPAGDAVWQTPTPVAGVAAARRPTPAGMATPSAAASTPMPAPPSAASGTPE